MNTHTISLTVENRHGALSRIANLFSSRGYNISSLNVAETEDPSISRMTIVVAGDEDIIEQVVKQCNRLIDVIKVTDFSGEPTIDRETLLLRVDTGKSNRDEVVRLATLFGAKVAGASSSSLVLELTAEPKALDDFVAGIKPFGLKELVRSGPIALSAAKK
jgi:acetolactate synthase I/III small subunit